MVREKLVFCYIIGVRDESSVDVSTFLRVSDQIQPGIGGKDPFRTRGLSASDRMRFGELVKSII